MPPAPALYLDLQAAQSVAHAERGIARYSIELTRALLRRGAAVDSIALSPHLPEPRGLPDDLATSDLLGPRTAESLLAATRRGPFTYTVLSPMEFELPTLRTIPESAAVRANWFVAVVYDLIPLVFEDRYLAAPSLRAAYHARLALLRNADLLLTISEHTRRDVIRLLRVPEHKVVTIGGGASDWFSRGSGDAGVGSPYVFCVSGWEWRKNTERLIRAYGAVDPHVRSGRRLVITCSVPPEGVQAWRDEAAAAGLRDDELVVTGHVDDERLRALYRGCDLFVFPSLYEGFGLPVLEAARCGAPIVTSRTSSLPEILELPESTFDPESLDDITAAITRGLVDHGLRERLRVAAQRAAEVHTWDAVATRAMDAVAALGSRTTSRMRAPSPIRVAFVGPLPPTESGVAVYNERVLSSLSEHRDLDVTVFSEGEPATPGARDRPFRVYPVESLDSCLDPHDYDVFVHTIGNQRYHVRGYDLALRHPGVVWLHDVSLVGLHLEWALWQIRTGRTTDDVFGVFRRAMQDMYGDRVRPDDVLTHPLSHRSFVERGVHLAAGLVSSARHLVVNSTVARDMVRADVGPGRALPPCTVLPHAVPDAPAVDARSHGSGRVLVALGVVHAVKRPQVLVKALARLGPDVRLAFVGPCDDEVRDEIHRTAEAAGVSGRIEVTGRVDSGDYWQWLARADVAVQLREPTFGESSGAIHDAIAAGVPVVTSVASARDLPSGALRFVGADVSAVALATVLRDLLADSEARQAMVAAGRAYATEWSFDRVTDRLAEVVRDVVLSTLRR